MTPKEKAIELVDRFNQEVRWNDAKQCALIAVDEMLDRWTRINFYSELNYIQEFKYWQEVKQEIDNITN
jgi:hypothetical protein